MNNQLAVKQKCILVRGGLEVWVDEDRKKNLENILNGKSRYLNIDGDLINTVDIVGVFSPQLLDDYKKTKRGMWKCAYEQWHQRNDGCICHQSNTRPFIATMMDEGTVDEETLERFRKGKVEFMKKHSIQ